MFSVSWELNSEVGALVGMLGQASLGRWHLENKKVPPQPVRSREHCACDISKL